MFIYIKYMVSLRCKMVVKQELEKLGLHYVNVDLGIVEILEKNRISKEPTGIRNLFKIRVYSTKCLSPKMNFDS